MANMTEKQKFIRSVKWCAKTTEDDTCGCYVKNNIYWLWTQLSIQNILKYMGTEYINQHSDMSWFKIEFSANFEKAWLCIGDIDKSKNNARAMKRKSIPAAEARYICFDALKTYCLRKAEQDLPKTTYQEIQNRVSELTLVIRKQEFEKYYLSEIDKNNACKYIASHTFECEKCGYQITIDANKIADAWYNPTCAICIAETKAPTPKPLSKDIEKKKIEIKERFNNEKINKK